MSDIIKQPTHGASPAAFDLSPRSLDEAMKFAELLADSSIVPKDFSGKPGNVLVAIQWGMELGLKPMQAMQNIAVINGRPAVWGDALLALVLASPACEYIDEWEEGGVAYCEVKRIGKPKHVTTFSEEDAKRAGLSGKQGPWTQYPQRMRKMRARAFALRDNFADVLKGIPVAEEVADMEPIERDITPRATPAQIAQRAADSGRVERTPAHTETIAKLERAAKEYGLEALSGEWNKLTKEDRKAIGTEELARLKKLAAIDATPSEPAEGNAPDADGAGQREPGADDE